MPNTGGWQQWQAKTFGSIQLPAGTQSLWLFIDGGGFDLDYLDFAPATSGGFALKVDFQPAGSPTVSGYVVDAGGVYGPRNGRTYGRNAAVETRDRDVDPDQRLDTLALMQAASNPSARWELAVPDGTYEVHVVCGDPSYFDGKIRPPGRRRPRRQRLASASRPFREGTVIVRVSDGRLTLTNGAGSYNTKICYLEAWQLPTGSG